MVDIEFVIPLTPFERGLQGFFLQSMQYQPNKFKYRVT